MTYTGNTFRSRPDMYAKNFATGEQLNVTRAVIETDTGTTPGVAIFRGKFFLFCLTTEHAWKLSDQLTDALDGLQEGSAA